MGYNFDFTGLEFIPANYQEALAGGVAGGVVAALGILAFLLLVAFYVYHSLAWSAIAKKMKHKKPWLAWIPFASSAMRLQLGKKFHWAWVFLYIIPVLGFFVVWILLIISHWQIFEKLKWPGWFSLAPAIDVLPGITGLGGIAYFVTIGIVAWKKK